MKTTERTAGDTSKAKPAIAKDLKIALAILQPKTICWVPFPMDADLKRLVTMVAAARSTDDSVDDKGNSVPGFTTKVHKVLHDLLAKAVVTETKAWQEETKDMIAKEVKELEVDDIQKMMEKAQRDLIKWQEAMALKTAEKE